MISDANHAAGREQELAVRRRLEQAITALQELEAEAREARMHYLAYETRDATLILEGFRDGRI